jgi:hypothetical protein
MIPFVFWEFLNDPVQSVYVSEVRELDLSRIAEKYVRRRDIAVDDAGGVTFIVDRADRSCK